MKPKINTIVSIGIFITICLCLSGYMLLSVFESDTVIWYQYAIVVVLGPLALGLMAKTMLGYKRVKIGKNKISIHFPLRFKKSVFSIKDIRHWTEQIVKTAGGTFKELVVLFENGKKLTLSLQEHTNYLETVKYLKSKCGRKFMENK
ncbi:MAG: hypothetical protein AAF519_19860 [Bacteroidota bacterium]